MLEEINIRKLKPTQINGRINTSSFNKETNEVNVVFGTEALVQEEFPDGERFYEQLKMTPDAANLDRFNNGASVLDSHGTESIKNQFGKVVRAWIDPDTKEGFATLKLSSAPAWETTVHDIATGIIDNISFTFRRDKMKDTGQTKDGLRILQTTKWQALELSFVTVPADFKPGTRSEELSENDVTIINHLKNKTMTEQEKLDRKNVITDVCRKLKLTEEFTNTLINDELITVDIARSKAIDEATKEVVEEADKTKIVDVNALRGTERKRALEIIGVCRKLGIEKAEDKEGLLFTDELIGKDITLDQARSLAIDKAHELQTIGISGANPASVKNKSDNEAKRALCKENALLERVGIIKDDKGVKLETDIYRGMSLKELAFETIIERGFNPRMMTEKDIKSEVFALGSRSGGQLTTSDFPSIMENVLNKIARNQYSLAERTWEPWTRKATATDFKQMSRPILNDILIDIDKDVINESGEYSTAQMNDSTEKYAIRKWGKIVPLSWEAIINDDLSMLDRTTASIVAGFTQAQNRMVYRTLTSAAALADKSNVMTDGNVIFTSGHKNLATTAATISLDSLTAARQLLRQQKAPNGNALNLKARFLVVGPALETLAEQYTSANFTPNASGSINKFGPTLTPIVDANITDTSWYLIADPATIDTIEVASLGGQDLYTESRYSFKIDGLETKVRMTFGDKALDWRGMVKNAGV